MVLVKHHNMLKEAHEHTNGPVTTLLITLLECKKMPFVRYKLLMLTIVLLMIYAFRAQHYYAFLDLDESLCSQRVLAPMMKSVCSNKRFKSCCKKTLGDLDYGEA